jgi:hypothetical protein
MTVIDATNVYGHFRSASFEDTNGFKVDDDATWTPGASGGTIVLTMAHFGTIYGRYTVDESSGRARLTIELSRAGIPPAITANAAVYVERSPIYLTADAQALGLIK